MRYEIFRAGTHIDNNGRRVTITAADLAEAASAYDPVLHEAPVVVGHPQTDAPAFGWVGGLAVSDGVLSADFAQVDESFADLVRAGRYKKVSASFYPPDSPSNPTPGKWALRHVGFLGAQPPAVKGLAAVQFAEDDVFVAFGEYAHSRTASVFRRLREWLIGQFGVEAADQVVPEWDIRDIDDAGRAPLESLPAFADPQPQPTAKENDMATEEQLAAEKAAREAAEQKAAAAEAALKRLQDEQAKDLRDGAHQQNAEFAEGLIQAGRLKPADKDLLVQVLDFAEYPQHTTADFGEGEAKKPLAAALREFLGAVLPRQLPVGELAKGSPAFAEGMSHHERALAYQQTHHCSYEEAARRTAD